EEADHAVVGGGWARPARRAAGRLRAGAAVAATTVAPQPADRAIGAAGFGRIDDTGFGHDALRRQRAPAPPLGSRRYAAPGGSTRRAIDGCDAAPAGRAPCSMVGRSGAG